jgi:ubiquitin carboxyl-terminal hydrolase 8
MNGHTNGVHSNGADGWQGSNAAGDPRSPGGSYPPIAEIVSSASETVETLKHHSIKHLLEQGRKHYGNAKVMLNNRSPIAGAYWEYLVAFQIIVDLIPRHRDYYDQVDASRSQTHRDFRELLKEIKSAEERFVRIKEIIKNDNLRNGGHHTRSTSTASLTRSESRSSSRLSKRDDELMLPDVPTSAPSGIGARGPGLPSSPRQKPVVQPKPQNLHGQAVHRSTASLGGPHDLTQRFANLRGLGVDTGSARSSQDLSVKMPSPAEYHPPSRPTGPRDMPPPPLNMPLPLPKLPLNIQMATSLPKEPSPTYSPARNISGPASINPPRSTPRSMNGTGGRSNSIAASSISSHAPDGNGVSGSYFPAMQPTREVPGRTRSVSKTVELEIDAEKLYDYIRMYKLLIIDVRNRADFDSGHIYVRSIMCIEPETLGDGYSADQLQDRLVISPDEEVAMFDQRDDYDVIVYYDNSTQNADFLSKPVRNDTENALKCLYETLHEYNADKPLKRPPVFLKGGLDAWVDIVGPQGLKMSTTSALVASGQTRSRAIRRSPAASHAAKAAISQRRSRREYVPMDEEEEEKWREEARKGRAVVEQPVTQEEHEEQPSPFYRTTEDFLRRYPDVEPEQSMMYPLSKPPSGNHYISPAIPAAPSRPAPSVPRVNYGGAHERQVAPQGRGNQPPVYLSQPRFTNVKMHRTGLLNFGVTCYMNSVVQCLSGHLLLSDLFLSQRYQRDLQRDNWKGTKGILPEAYATLVSNLFKGDVTSVRPSTFRVSVSIVISIESALTRNSGYAVISTPNGALTSNKMPRSFSSSS